EMFFDDAVTASRILDITLTSRDKGKEDSVPLCGFPFHAVSGYIARLIDRGYKVAVCEQVEDPKAAKGIVRREVVRVVTPGLVVDPANLAEKENNFFGAVYRDGGVSGLAFADISTGEFRLAEFDGEDILLDELDALNLREMLVTENDVPRYSGNLSKIILRPVSTVYFEEAGTGELLASHFSAEVLGEAGLAGHGAVRRAAGAVLRYIRETQKENLSHINRLEWHGSARYLVMDQAARRNLELFSTLRDNRREGSLFHVLDETVTAMGGRRLRRWLGYPLLSPEIIRERLSAVSEMKSRHSERRDLREGLRGVQDMERLGSRVAMGVANARDLSALRTSMEKAERIKAMTAVYEGELLASIHKALDPMTELRELLQRAIVDDPPLSVREGGMIREGYDAALDELISASRDGKKWIAALEKKEKERTGISSLKVGFNQVFGYYIEITKANAALVPPEYIRKQTLVGSERYINEELKEYEYRVLHAEDRRREMEHGIFTAIRNTVAGEIRRIQGTASLLADLDALASLAEVAERYRYVCPRIHEGDAITIRDGRHPVVERMDLPEGFVPNDARLDLEKNRLLIITGPNMAGKSTFIRQVALIVLMAQMGSFVPAREAEIGVVDRIFTRLGASDSLSTGQSTFMVEMTEVAHLLRRATSRSLILLDEVGRGTSTFDGLSIAWAVAEHIDDPERLGARALFATHYHELTDLARTRPSVQNYAVAVRELEDQVIFLRKIVEGGTNRSYGIQVARLAGVPGEVIGRAREILRNLEKGELDEIGMPRMARGTGAPKRKGPKQLSLFASEEDRVLGEIRGLDLDAMTPLEALGRLASLQKQLKNS
ncbi:MAG TPA: DNA mismatch repair protein MutS, partial [Syntrophales bacterium]|nr:DNA mismatch repair protein MutS [Syntrophales bacterium]